MRLTTNFCSLALLIAGVLAQYDDYGIDFGGPPDCGDDCDGESTGSSGEGGGTAILVFIIL